MTERQPENVTRLLHQWGAGDAGALEQLTPLIYDELHRLARRQLGRERHVQTLQTSALVHEAFLRLVGNRNGTFENRSHFFGLSANLMRQILVDFARRRRAEKRGGSEQRVPLDLALGVPGRDDEDLVELDAALSRLAAVDPRQSRIVELRFFGGLSEEETAEVLDVSPRTVRREWSLARAWLLRELRSGAPA